MKPRLSVITIGVKDFKKSIRFYKEGLSWPTSATENDNIAFFLLNNGMVFALYPKEKLAEDAMVSSVGSGFAGITFAHNVASEKQVEEILKTVSHLGAKIVKKGQKTFWGGYSGYFSDPDGYLWEVVHNPHWKLDKNENVILS